MFNLTRITLLFLAFNLTSFNAYSFQSTSLRIVVLDQNSDAVEKPTIRLTGENSFRREFKETDLKVVTFANLKAGAYVLEVGAKGFKPVSQEIALKSGENKVEVRLELAEIREDVDIAVDAQDKSLDSSEGAFTGVLTEQQIQDLPSDPTKLKEELQRLAGPGAEILVDGLEDQQLPPKDQIASIKIVRTSFDAEFHRAGNTYVRVVTKAGGSSWHGSFTFGFNDDLFNARNAFVLEKPPSHNKNYSYNLNGPIIKGKASLSIFGFTNRGFRTGNIVAVLPTGQVNESVRRNQSWTYNEGKFSYNLTKNHPLNIGFGHRASGSDNSGVGRFNLRERGFESNSRTDRISVSTSGLIWKRFLHEFRMQYRDQSSRSIPISDKVSTIVLDSFSAGGANSNNRSRTNYLSIGENIVFGAEKHTIKFGGKIEYERQKLSSADNINGSFIFSSLNDFLLNRPSRFTQRLGLREIELSQFQFGTFIQDDIRLHKTLMLSLGLRYEWQNNLKDKNNFSPRVSFSWSPAKKGKTVFRGGAGIYYDWFGTRSLSTILSRSIDRPSETIIINPGFPDPFAGGALEVLEQSFWQKDQNLESPQIFVTLFGISQRLGKIGSLRATYKFERGTHVFRSRDLNAPPLGGVRPDLNFGRIVNVESSAFYESNSLSFSFFGNIAKKIRVYGNYTLAKRISDSDGIFSLPTDNFNLALDRSVSSQDRRHQGYIYSGWDVRKDIKLSLSYNFSSPTPYSVTTGLDNNNDTNFNDRPAGVRRNSERGLWRQNVGANASWTYFFGSIPKKTGGGQGTVVIIGGSASPNTNSKQRYSIQFYTSANNLLNSANRSGFVGVQTSSFFGQPTSAGFARRINFGVRFGF